MWDYSSVMKLQKMNGVENLFKCIRPNDCTEFCVQSHFAVFYYLMLDSYEGVL